MKILLLVILVAVTVPARSSENKDGVWLGTTASKTLTEEFSALLETQIRYGFDSGQTNQVLYRAGVIQNLNLNKHFGYFYGLVKDNSSSEHRLTFEHGLKYGSFHEFNFTQRFRLEARFKEIESQDSSGRLRYLFRGVRNIAPSMGLVLSDEIFVNMNRTKWNGDNTFERNRFFVGIKRSFLETNRYEIGYMNQFTPRESGDITEHLLILFLFI